MIKKLALLAFALFIFGATTGPFRSAGQPTENELKRQDQASHKNPCDREFKAVSEAELHVELTLRFLGRDVEGPGLWRTVSRSGFDLMRHATRLSDCRFKVTSFFKTKNMFGGYETTSYTADVEYRGEKWHVSNVEFRG